MVKKQKRGRKPLLPRSKNPHKTAHARAWEAYSLYIRYSWADSEGLVKCFTCYRKFHYTEMDAGHFIHRAALDFAPHNVNPQCTKCNHYLSGNAILYTLNMIHMYGIPVVESLVRQIDDKVRYTIKELLDIESEYKKKLEDIYAK